MDFYTLHELSLLNINDEVCFKYKSHYNEIEGVAKVFQKTKEYIFIVDDEGVYWDFPLCYDPSVKEDKAYQSDGDYMFAIFKK